MLDSKYAGRLSTTLQDIIDNPGHWDQKSWHCGTSHCFAGFAQLRHDCEINQESLQNRLNTKYASSLLGSAINADYFGITKNAFETLTHPTNNLEQLKFLVSNLIANNGEVVIKDKPSVSLENMVLKRVDFSEAYLVKVNLVKANLMGANLRNANLFKAKLNDANLTGANLTKANLKGADLTGADLTRVDLFKADLIAANLKFAHLSGANLRYVESTEANLSGADLRRADLTGADLSECNLTDANLTGANLTKANLKGADLTGADLTFADSTGVNFS